MRTTNTKLSLLLSSLALTVAGCAGELAPIDDDAVSDESDLREDTAAIQVTYGFEYQAKEATVTFSLNPGSPDRERCAPEVRVVPRGERGYDPEVQRYEFKIPNRGGCLYEVKSFAFEVACVPIPARQCDGLPSVMHVSFGDPNGVDYHQWRLGHVMGTDGRSRQNVLVLPLDVHEGATAFSPLYDPKKIYYFGLRSGY